MFVTDPTYIRTIMAEREQEASKARLAKLARVARAAATCCEGRLASLRRRLSFTRSATPEAC